MESETAGRIRAAIAASRYEEALLLWDGYAAHLRQRLSAGSLTAAALSEAGELLSWSRTAMLCARAHLLDEAHSAYVTRVYASGSMR